MPSHYLEKMPDVEVRLYFPDGSIVRRFCPVEGSSTDADRFHVEATFLATESNRGIAYAEALVDDTAIAGAAFRTEGDDREGSFRDEDLYILVDGYSLEAAKERYDQFGKPKPDMTADDFDRLLDEFIRKEKESVSGGDDEQTAKEPEVEEELEAAKEPVERFNQEIDQLVGIAEVKQKLITYEKLMRFNAMRAAAGLSVSSMPLHSMFLGAPGTGKTTVAKMVGRMLCQVGLLSRGHVVVRERATLSGTHYCDHEDLTLKAIDMARGGILFIDEAYQLFQQNDPKDPGRIVIDTLLTALADEDNRDWMLILAGYPDEMRQMFNINPGLRSRIPESNIYTFADFSEDELMEIADRWFARNEYTLTAEARTALSRRLNADCAVRDKSFGNARHVVNMIQTDILPAMASRVMGSETPSAQSLTEILSADIPALLPKAQPSRRRIGFVS